ncbi:MAG: tetratricopeptide repeat protein [Saprospiraceae bacterium]
MPETWKNINYGNIHAGGNVHIGDVYLFHEGKAQPTLLFLHIEKAGEAYQANLSVKSGDSESVAQVLHEPVTLQIPATLFQQSDAFQSLRRSSENEILRHAGRESGGVQHREDALSAAIHQTFFSREIGVVCSDFIQLLEDRKIEELLLVVASDEATVRNLPWEMVLSLLFPPKMGEAKRHLMVNSFGFARTTQASLEKFQLRRDANADSPLKLLFITALPENLTEHGKMLEIEREQEKLIKAIGGLEATGDRRPKIVIEFLDNASLEEIDTALTARSHDILHISGHGAYLAEAKQGILYLENEDGDEQQVSGAELASVLRRHTCLRLLLLSACETAVAGQGTAEQLAAFGIPAVLAMRFAVTDKAATLFTSAFYEQLALGKTLNHALAHGREILWKDAQQRRQIPAQSHIAEWFTPVVHQNQYIGALAKPQQYREDVYHNFYPKTGFLKTGHTKLIGEGFIGRKRYLIQLRQNFRLGRAVCLHGLGGLGKTTLAEAFADSYRKRYGHEVLIFRGGAQISEVAIIERLFAQWQSATKPDAFNAQELKAALDSPQTQPLQKLELLIANCLAGRKLILIFDNFEDVQTGEAGALSQAIGDENLRAFLVHLLQHAPADCPLLFTTRYKITDFESRAMHLALDKMSHAEQWRHLNFSETLRRIPMVEREAVHRRLDGHPRAFEFLEGLMRNDADFEWAKLDASVGEVEARIFENLLLERIVARLGEAEKTVFETAGIFFTRSPIVALVAVIGIEEKVLRKQLAALQDWSLCFWDEKTGLFEVHELTREWLRREGRPDGETRKELAYKVAMFFKTHPTAPYDVELAIAYFEMAEAWGEFAGLSFLLQDYYQLKGFYQKAWVLNKAVLEKRVGENVALSNLGIISNVFGKYSEALAFYEQSLIICQSLGAQMEEGSVLNNIGQMYYAQGDFVKALNYLESSLIIRRKTSDHLGEVATLGNISLIHKVKGDNKTALHYLEESLKIARKIDDRQGEGWAQNAIGQIYETQGNYREALLCLEDSLKIMQETENRRGEGSALHNIGQLYITVGDYVKAFKFLEMSLSISKEIGDHHGEGMTLNDISEIYKTAGDYVTALDYLESSLKIRKEISDIQGEGATLNNIGIIHQDKGDYIKALSYLKSSLKIKKKIGDIIDMAPTLTNIGVILFEQGQLEEAVPFLVQAYGIFKKIDSPNLKVPESYLFEIIAQIGEVRFQELVANMNTPEE